MRNFNVSSIVDLQRDLTASIPDIICVSRGLNISLR